MLFSAFYFAFDLMILSFYIPCNCCYYWLLSNIGCLKITDNNICIETYCIYNVSLLLINVCFTNKEILSLRSLSQDIYKSIVYRQF